MGEQSLHEPITLSSTSNWRPSLNTQAFWGGTPYPDHNSIVFSYVFIHFFETKSHVAQVDLKLLNLMTTSLSTGITGMHHHTWMYSIINLFAVFASRMSPFCPRGFFSFVYCDICNTQDSAWHIEMPNKYYCMTLYHTWPMLEVPNVAAFISW
jgi:hypothetical protein